MTHTNRHAAITNQNHLTVVTTDTDARYREVMANTAESPTDSAECEESGPAPCAQGPLRRRVRKEGRLRKGFLTEHDGRRREDACARACQAITVSPDGSGNLSAVSTGHDAELEDDERHGDCVVGIACIEELPAARDGSPALHHKHGRVVSVNMGGGAGHLMPRCCTGDVC